MSREETRKKGKYFYVIEGSFREKVNQDHPEAIRRDWTSADGKTTGTKYERQVDHLFGFITNVQFHDGEYGTSINITLDENENGESPVIQLGTASREGEDFMRKLPGVNLAKEVRLRAFNFTGSDESEVRGIEVMQQNEEGDFTVKIPNFFRDSEKKENINGLPKPPKDNDEMTKDEWKLYFLQVRMFLINYTKDTIAPKFQDMAFVKRNEVKPIPQSKEEEDGYPTEKISPDDIPF